MERRDRYRELEDSRADIREQFQAGYPLHVERHDDGVARLRIRTPPEPATRNADRTVGAHHIDRAPVAPLRHAAAQLDIVADTGVAIEDMRGWIMHLAQHRDFLRLLRNMQLVSRAHDHIIASAVVYLVQLDHHASGCLRGPQLPQ